MNINNLKSSIRKKNNTIFWITNPNLINLEIAIKSNYFDIYVIDYEHSLISIDEIKNIIVLLNNLNLPILIRFAKFNIVEAPKFLDYGIDGIIASEVASLKQLNFIKKIIFYPEIGNRGVGLGRMNQHGKTFKNYMKVINKKLVFLPMIERDLKLNEIESIYKDKNVDGCLVGPYDLSMSLKQPGNFKSKKFKIILNHVIDMKKKYKKLAGIHFMDTNLNNLSKVKKKGFNFIPILTDVQFFKLGLHNIINK